jgi:ComF family protein
LHLFFPQLCLHCKSELPVAYKLLCPVCFDLLDFLQPEDRCPSCFALGCLSCQEKRPSADFIASCFDYTGPAKSLLKEFKYQDSPYLAHGLGSFLFLQFTSLDWPEPDIITFVPQSFAKAVSRGYNQAELLAEKLAELLSRPAIPLLKKTNSTHSQSLLTKEQRKELPQELFVIKEPSQIEGKSVLLIDDVYTTGTTIERAAWAIRQKNPAYIYALTVCHV